MLAALRARDPQARFVLELLTSMKRHGMTARELRSLHLGAGRAAAGLEGIALHLPLEQGSHLGEVRRLLNDIVGSGVPTRTVWVSHLTPEELATLRTSYADFTIRPRTGTALWLLGAVALLVARVVVGRPLDVWFTTCVTGVLLGGVGVAIFSWQRAASRRGSRTAQQGLDDEA